MSLKKKVEILRKMKRMEHELPHLYGFDLYPYQREFLNTTKEWQFLCAANQIGKTTTLLLKLVALATDKTLWKKLWVDQPQLFLYLLPNQKLHNENALTKWVSVLPRGEKREDDYYGWEWEKRGKDFLGINFNNGLRIRFLSYGQNIHSLQNLSAHVIAFDEEPNWDIVPEVQTRTSAIRVADGNIAHAYGGFKIFGFTATKSQTYFREILEERGENERFPVSQGNVYKRTVSLYDCKKHASGAPSQWTEEKIEKIKSSLPTEAEIKRRVYGRFQASEGLVYQSFEMTRNTIDHKVELPPTWGYYGGIDYGAGGTSHPSAIVLVAVDPEYHKAYVTDCWLGLGELTTCDDVILKYMEMIKKKNVIMSHYDWAAKDLHTFATRRGVSLFKANKDRDKGRNILNALFKSGMLKIEATDYFNNRLISEIGGLTDKIHKKHQSAQDHLTDALRYAVSSIPWDFTNPTDTKLKVEIAHTLKGNRVRLRSGRMSYLTKDEGPQSIESELHEWGDLFEEF